MKVLVLLLAFTTILATTHAESLPELIRLPISDGLDDERLGISYPSCPSWRLGVEAHNIINFQTVPANCESDVAEYLLADGAEYPQYRIDSKTVCKEAYFFAKGLALKNDTVNIWIFDVDETLLSNIPYFEKHHFGVEKLNKTAFGEWVAKGEAPVLPESLHLYNNLVNRVGLHPVLVTSRPVGLQEVTLKNLHAAGYTYWKETIFKPYGAPKNNAEYKAGVRKKLKKSGYTIMGNTGDQWSDLLNGSPAKRNFKLPNPLYYTA